MKKHMYMINMNESLCDIRLSHRLFEFFAKKSRVTLMSFWCATMVASYIRIINESIIDTAFLSSW